MKTSRKSKVESRKGLVALCLALCPGTVLAQVMNDPTRPPSGYAAEAQEEPADVGGAMTLQSVLISPTHKAAIISGVMVRLGEKYRDAVLVRVTENEVVLRSGSESQVLKLYPGVEKRSPASAPPRADRSRNQGGASPAQPR